MFPWLTYIARNAIRKALRQSRRHVSVEALWDAVDERMLAGFRALRDAPLADEWLARQETADLVRMALSQIPPQYQRSLEQHYFYDRTLKQAAEIDGTSEGAAKVRLHRARLAFKAAFESIVETLADQRPPRKVPS
jgi:RNA polymerase sigma-70 factor (ECF subfamily)